MKTVTETFNIYTFDELEDVAKNKALCYYEQKLTNSQVFTDFSKDVLDELFPNSQLEVEYNLGCSQGDYFNFYGTLNLGDLFTHISSKLSSKQVRLYRHILKKWFDSCEIPCGNSYNNRTATNTSILDDTVGYMERYGYSNIPYSDIEEINDTVRSYLSDVCKSLQNDGYSYFYPDSDYIRDYFNDNEYYFTEDGKPYY